MSLPKTIYVAERDNGSDPVFMVAEYFPEDAIEDDGPTQVGTYKLVAKRKLAKKATEVK